MYYLCEKITYMKTKVIMKRPLFGIDVEQDSQNGYFEGKSIEMAGNRHRLQNNLPPVKLQEFLRLNKTKEFLESLKKHIGKSPKIIGRGRNSKTWLHPFLFIDFALYISPELKIEVYSWLYDELLKYRNDSGDSYKKMAGALWLNCKNKSNFTKGIQKTAEMIRLSCGVKDWEHATEEQLKLRDKIHENIALLCDVLKDNNTAIRIGIMKSTV